MKLALLDAHNSDYDDIAKISCANKSRYCKKHGYDFQVYKFGRLEPENRTPHWGRIPGLQEHIKNYDWIFYSDTDAVILNFSIKIHDFIDENYNIIAGPLPHEGHLSTAGLLVKNCPWTLDFLEHWYKQIYFIDKPYYADPSSDHGATSTDGGGYYFEQSAFEYLYDTDESIREKIKRVPRKVFNSIASSAYLFNEGDFLVHFPGISHYDKLQCVKKWVKKSIKC